MCKSALDGTGRYPGGAGYPPHPWITAEHTAVMAWVGLSISGPIDGKRGSASNNERTTRQNTPAGCQIGPAGVISVCGKYPHTYTRIQISGKSRTRASKPPAGLAGFRGGGLHGTGKAARRDTSPTAPRFPPPLWRVPVHRRQTIFLLARTPHSAPPGPFCEGGDAKGKIL